MSEALVGITHRLYEARDAVRFLHGDKYAAKIAEYQGYTAAQMQKAGAGRLKATIQLIQILQEKHPDSGTVQALILAAYVEMIEPSNTESASRAALKGEVINENQN